MCVRERERKREVEDLTRVCLLIQYKDYNHCRQAVPLCPQVRVHLLRRPDEADHEEEGVEEEGGGSCFRLRTTEF